MYYILYLYCLMWGVCKLLNPFIDKLLKSFKYFLHSCSTECIIYMWLERLSYINGLPQNFSAVGLLHTELHKQWNAYIRLLLQIQSHIMEYCKRGSGCGDFHPTGIASTQAGFADVLLFKLKWLGYMSFSLIRDNYLTNLHEV